MQNKITFELSISLIAVEKAFNLTTACISLKNIYKIRKEK